MPRKTPSRRSQPARSPRRAAAAFDLGGTKLAAAVVSREGRLLERRTEPADISSKYGPIEQICRLALEFRAQGWNIHAAGVAVPGLVRRNGTVWAPNIPGWNNMPVASLLTRCSQLPVVVESDRNAAVLGETWRGAAQGKSDVIVLIVGTGIGAGILAGGQLLRGSHELSGCAGWLNVVDADNPEFRRVGCLEALAAGPGIARQAREALRLHRALAGRELQALTAVQVADAARHGDELAREIFRNVGSALGLAVANMISLLDPQVVVFSGGMAGAADLFFEHMRETALARSQPIAARQVKIKLSRLGADANLLGMGRLAWQL